MLSFKAASNIHARSFSNKSLIEISKDAACFNCIRKFPAAEVRWFSSLGNHAFCPFCDRQTVVGDTLVQGKFAIRTPLLKQEMIEINEIFNLESDFE